MIQRTCGCGTCHLCQQYATPMYAAALGKSTAVIEPAPQRSKKALCLYFGDAIRDENGRPRRREALV